MGCRFAIVLAATVLLLPASGRAQQPEANTSRSMTLVEALAYAHEHQPSLLAARDRILAAQAAAEVPRAAWLPSVNGAAQVIGGSANNSTTSFAASSVDMVRVGGTTPNSVTATPYVSTVLAVGLRQEVYDFGRVAALSAAADALVKVQTQQTDVAELDVVFAVTSAFYAVQAAHELVTAAERAYSRAGVNRNDAAAGVQQGVRRPIDLTRAEADSAQFAVRRIQAAGGLTSAQTVFAAVVGVPDALLDASGPLNAASPLLDEAQAVKAALSNAPEVLSARAAVEAQEAQTVAVAAALRPDLSLTSSASTRGGGAPAVKTTAAPSGTLIGDGVLPYVPNYDVGLVFNWPLLDFTVQRRTQVERETELVRREELANVQLQVTSNVQQAWVAASVADEAIVGLQRSNDAALANAKQAEALYGAGLSTSLELADAEYLRVDAEVQLAIGRFTQMQARARLARAMGQAL